MLNVDTKILSKAILHKLENCFANVDFFTENDLYTK